MKSKRSEGSGVDHDAPATASLGFVGGFVVAGFAAGWAIVEAILTEANPDLSLTESAIFLALALVFRHLALHAAVFPGRGGHKRNVTPGPG